MQFVSTAHLGMASAIWSGTLHLSMCCLIIATTASGSSKSPAATTAMFSGRYQRLLLGKDLACCSARTLLAGMLRTMSSLPLGRRSAYCQKHDNQPALVAQHLASVRRSSITAPLTLGFQKHRLDKQKLSKSGWYAESRQNRH